MTKIQESICRIVLESDDHVTAEQVLAAVKKEHPTVSLSTTYRNLNIFADTGRIRRIQRAIGADYYERNLDPHDHAYCVRCGKIMDIKIPELKGILERSFPYPILSFDLLVNYVCPACEDK